MLMRHQWARVFLALVGLLSFVVPCKADDTQKNDQSAQDQQVVSSKGVAQPSAAAVNFRKELGLPFPSLNTLGARITAARRAGDPVALAHAASELAVAEKVSGKTATITSRQVLSESAQLARLRKRAAELEAVAEVAKQVQAEENLVYALKQDIAASKAVTQSEQQAFQANEEPTFNAARYVAINNYTLQYLDIWVNGNLRTQLAPGSRTVLTLDQASNPTVLTAYGNDDSTTWGPRYIWGRFQKYTWNIN
jgi:hypothetical protein